MKQTLGLILLLTILLQTSNSPAGELDNEPRWNGFDRSTDILPVDEAFRFGSFHDGPTIKVFWQVMPGYFLYRDKIELLQNGETLPIELPVGEWRQDEIFGKVMVLDGLIELEKEIGAGGAIEIRYQGCAEQGYCYPPQKKHLTSVKL